MGRLMNRLTLAAVSITAIAATAAPAASARVTGGEGWYGPTTDLTVTYFGFGIIFLFPLLLVILSIIQRRKENREHEALEAMHSRPDLAEWQGGW